MKRRTSLHMALAACLMLTLAFGTTQATASGLKTMKVYEKGDGNYTKEATSLSLTMNTTDKATELRLMEIDATELYVLDSVPPQYNSTYSTNNYEKDYGCVFAKFDADSRILKITPLKAGTITLYASVGTKDELASKTYRVSPTSSYVPITITVKDDGKGVGYLIVNNRNRTDAVTIKTSEDTKTLSISAMTSGSFLIVPQSATASELKASDVVYPAQFPTDFTYFTAKLTQTATGGSLTLTPKLSGTGALKLYLCRTTEHGSLHVINEVLDVFTLSVGVEYTGTATEKLAVNLATETFGAAEIAARYNVVESAIQWFSNDITIATVQNGRIVGLKNGITVVTAYIPTLNRMIEITVTVPLNTVTPTPTPTATPVVTPTPTATPAPVLTKFKVLASSLNVRSGPSTAYGKVGSIARNKIVYGYLTNDGEWVQVKVSDNKSLIKKDGYISAMYVMLP